MNAPGQMVYVVDDDARVCEAVHDLLLSFGLHVTAFGSAAAFMAFARPDIPACLVLDIGLPDINGLDLQRRLAGSPHPPIVFITGQGDIPSSVRAMKEGAVDFLSKPFNAQQLLTAIETGLARDRHRRAAEAELSSLRIRYQSLTPREREVLPFMVYGLLNKLTAAELHISEVTLQIHRTNIMRKMGARSLPKLVRMSIKLGIPELRDPPSDQHPSWITFDQRPA
jgi:FixJ family two-component response regulator